MSDTLLSTLIELKKKDFPGTASSHLKCEGIFSYPQNIQSTNWQTMRFKPPPPNSKIGWRVEFRPCEAQLTDFENAAYVCFVVLLTRVILSYHLNFVMPISKVSFRI